MSPTRLSKHSGAKCEDWTAHQKLIFDHLVGLDEDPVIVAAIGIKNDGRITAIFSNQFSNDQDMPALCDEIAEMFHAIGTRNRQ